MASWEVETYRLLNSKRRFEILHGVQENEHLVALHRLNVRCMGNKACALPLVDQAVTHIDERRIKLGLGRKTRVVEPTIPVNRGKLVLQLRVLGRAEKVEERLLELEGIERLVRPCFEVVGDELVKVLPAH